MNGLMNCAYHLTKRAAVQCSRARAPSAGGDHRYAASLTPGLHRLGRRVAWTTAGRRGPASRKPAAQDTRRRGVFALVVPPRRAYNGQTSKAIVHFTIFASSSRWPPSPTGRHFSCSAVIALGSSRRGRDAHGAALRSGLAPDASPTPSRAASTGPSGVGGDDDTIGTVFLCTLSSACASRREVSSGAARPLGAYMLFDYVRCTRRRDVFNSTRSAHALAVAGAVRRRSA